MADTALQFDGSQNYLSLGTLGSFGANIGNGFYTKFSIKTAQVTKGAILGSFNGATTFGLQIELNTIDGSANSSDALRIFIRSNSGATILLDANITAAGINNNNTHVVEITVNFSNATVVITVDGVSKTVNYVTQNTGGVFVNFTNAMLVGAKFLAVATEFLGCIIDNLLIGTSPSVLYGNYVMNEGTGTTTADTSGNSNTATLTGSPVPAWVQGLSTLGSNASLMGVG